MEAAGRAHAHAPTMEHHLRQADWSEYLEGWDRPPISETGDKAHDLTSCLHRAQCFILCRDLDPIALWVSFSCINGSVFILTQV